MSTPAERDDPDEIAQRQMMNLFLGTARAYGGKWNEIFGEITDEREAWKTHYPLEAMLFSGVLVYHEKHCDYCLTRKPPSRIAN